MYGLMNKKARNTYYIYHIIDVTVLFDSLRCYRQCMRIETELIYFQNYLSKIFTDIGLNIVKPDLEAALCL